MVKIKSKFIVCFIYLSIAFLNSYLFAELPNNTFMDKDIEAQISRIASPENPSNSVRATDSLKTGLITDPSDDPNINCVDGEECIVKNPTKLPNINSYSEFFPVFSPISGFTSAMESPYYTTKLNELAGSALPIQMVTWQLVEPGIAQGIYHAAMLANGLVANHYRADNNFLKKTAISPNTQQVVIGAYHSCIAKKMASTGLKSSWLEAQSECLGGNETILQPFSMLNDDPATAEDHNSHDPSNNGAGPTELYLTDILFSLENSATVSGVSLQDLKEDFRQLVGDIKLILAQTNDTDPNFNNRNMANTGVYRIGFEYIAPTTMEGSREIEVDKNYWIKKITDEVYNTILLIAEDYCDWVAWALNYDGNPYSMFKTGSVSNRESNYWAQGIDDVLPDSFGALAMISAEGILPSPPLLESVFSSLEEINNLLEEDHSSASYSSLVDQYCRNIYVSGSSFEVNPYIGYIDEGKVHYTLDKIFGGKDLSGSSWNIDDKVEFKETVNSTIRNIYSYARKIGIAKYYSGLILLRNYVLKTAGGSFNKIAKNKAIELIQERSGVSDLDEAYSNLVQETKEFMKVMFKEAQDKIGKNSLPGMVKTDGSQSSPNNPMGGN